MMRNSTHAFISDALRRGIQCKREFNYAKRAPLLSLIVSPLRIGV